MLPLAALLALAPIDFVPPLLGIEDLAFGTSAPVLSMPPVTHLGLVPGHAIRYRVSGAAPSPGTLAILSAAPALLAVPLPLGSSFLYLDPAGLVVLGAAVVDPSGAAAFDFALPPTLTLGVALACQGATLAPQTGVLKPSNFLTHVVTDAHPIPVASFSKSQHPSATSSGALVLHSELAWQSFWSQHAPGGPAAPQVDFTTQVVVVGFAGSVPTTGASLVIDQLAPLATGGLEVRQTLTLPGLGCPAAPAEQTPGAIVRVDRVAGAAPVAATTVVAFAPPCP